MRHLERDLRARRSAPSEARALVAEIGTGLPVELLDRAELAVSELVTNAVRHGSDPGASISLWVSVDGQVMQIQVSDHGASFPAPFTKAGGFGLGIVDRVADDLHIDPGSTWSVSATFTPR